MSRTLHWSELSSCTHVPVAAYGVGEYSVDAGDDVADDSMSSCCSCCWNMMLYPPLLRSATKQSGCFHSLQS
jgi:hypothetical protein